MNPLDIAKAILCTAKQAHLETETKEDILRNIFTLIKIGFILNGKNL